MNNLEEKEKKLNGLINRLNNLSHSYSQSSYDTEKIKTERNQLEGEKKRWKINTQNF